MNSIVFFLKNWLGLNPTLPEAGKIKEPTHGMKARNTRGQKVLWDEKQGKWVLPQNFSDKLPVEIK